MSDLIDRHAAIDAAIEATDSWEGFCSIGRQKRIENYINSLPFAPGMDCISRQAAIDYFVTNVGFHDEDGYPIEDECELREIWTGYFDGIPSAQPEPLKIDLSGYSEEDWERFKKEWGNTPITVLSAQPKRGKWIKTARWSRVYYCNQCRNYLDFDGVNAGRGSTNFCPNCGAKMEVTE